MAAAAACPRASPLPRKRGGTDGGEGRAREAEGRRALCAPYLRAKGEAAVNARKGWGKGMSVCPLASPFRHGWAEMGGRHGWEGEGREGTLFAHPILYESGGTQDSGEDEGMGGKVGVARQSVHTGPCGGCKSCLPQRGARGHGTPGSSPSHLTAQKGARVGTAPPTPSPIRAEGGAQRGHTTPPLRTAPFPFPFPLRATPYAQGTRGHAPPSPFARMSGATRAHPPPRLSTPPPSPSPSLFAPPRLCGKGARDPGPSLPLGRATPYAGEREDTPPPVPPFPIRADGGRNEGTPPHLSALPPPPSPSLFAPPRSCG
ncbi:hypothetical protein EDB83DRAFT_2317205 [Lactarius deliciosus]|nr:hypothetical protein EDB83DRAFT_2317205 [Lactarius deliciosus]